MTAIVNPVPEPDTETRYSPSHHMPDRSGPGGLAGEGHERRLDTGCGGRAMADACEALGIDGSVADHPGTAAQVVLAYAETFASASFEARTFSNDDGYDELVVTTHLPFCSLDAEHLFAHSGVAHIGYVPAELLIGAPELAGLIESHAQQPQSQQHLTNSLADWLGSNLAPGGVGVVLDAKPARMTATGSRANDGARTITSALSGQVRDDEWTRREFLTVVAAQR